MIDPASLLAIPGARLLVIAPHPDDESISAAGLLARARTVDAKARVLLLTDGERNPWPQRWLERRWRISPADRSRWGVRRRSEAHAAAAAIGLPGSALTCLGWPDLGVTDRLMTDTRASVDTLASAINTFKPSVLVFPALADTHPDHGACHVLVRLALARPDMPKPECLTYHVHGSVPTSASTHLHLDANEVDSKRRAVLAHESQLALTRSRLLHQVGSLETYWPPGPAETHARSTNAGLALPWHPPRILRRRCELLLVAGERAWHQSLPWSGPMSVDCGAQSPVFAKLRLRKRNPWIFDHWGWRCLRAERLTDSMDSAKLVDGGPVAIR